MATSEVGICNEALLYIGVPPIADFDQGGDVATACKTHYEPTRDEVLESYEWTFATRFTTLTLVGETVDLSGYPQDYSFAYTLPADFLTVVKIADNIKRPRADQFIEYRIVGHPTLLRVLLTDAEDAQLHYVARITNATLFSALFAEALSWRMAEKLARSLKADPREAKAAHQMFLMRLSEAVARDNVNRQDGIDPPSRFEAARI